MAWNLEGTLYENCSCTAICPCTWSNMTAPATNDFCNAALVFNIASGEIDGTDEHGVVQTDLNFLSHFVTDREVEVVGVGDDRRTRHPLERLTQLVGDRPQPVPDDLVGQRIEVVDLLLGDGVDREGRR